MAPQGHRQAGQNGTIMITINTLSAEFHTRSQMRAGAQPTPPKEIFVTHRFGHFLP
jgi:hypothetical protein